MKLLKLCEQEVIIGHPLPWAVYNGAGQLLLNKGFVLNNQDQVDTLMERGVYADADDYEEEARKQRHTLKSLDPFSIWFEVHRRTASLLQNHHDQANFAADLANLGDTIQEAIDQDVDVGKFEMAQNDSPNYAVTHSLQTAVVGSLVADRLGASAHERKTVICASLTMNIAILDLQNQLVSQLTPLTDEQRQTIQQHSAQGCTMLEALGVTDPEWLKAVGHHHVTNGGGPLPENHREIGQVACLIHYVDVYLAKMSSRATRPAQSTQAAAQNLFLAAGGANNQYTAAIVKEMGIYPPGTFVKLASGETGIVIRSGETAHCPQVNALTNPDGMLLPMPMPRNTALPANKILNAVARSNVLIKLDRSKLLGYPA